MGNVKEANASLQKALESLWQREAAAMKKAEITLNALEDPFLLHVTRKSALDDAGNVGFTAPLWALAGRHGGSPPTCGRSSVLDWTGSTVALASARNSLLEHFNDVAGILKSKSSGTGVGKSLSEPTQHRPVPFGSVLSAAGH